MAARRLLPLLVLVAPLLCGCSHHRHPSRSELRERRADLVIVARALAGLQPPVAAELSAARSVWPLIDRGFVRRLHRRGRPEVELRRGAALAGALARAAAAAKALPAKLTPQAERLTGPAAGLAGLYQLYSGLVAHAYNELRALEQLPNPPPQSLVSFLLGSANLYVAAIYDAHFDLSYLGKGLVGAYKRLGGETAFGRRLSGRTVMRIASFYSKRLRLAPHPWQLLNQG